MLTPDEQAQYAERDAIIRKLGFSSYKVYLVSALWKEIRRQVLLPNTRCRTCGRKATQVHHNRYKLVDMNGACLDHLIPVCGKHHHIAEFNNKGSKLGPQRATQRLDDMRVEQQKIWHRQDAKIAWQTFFATIEEVRIYIGMDPTPEGRELTAKLDSALDGLPPKPPRKPKKPKYRAHPKTKR